MKRSAVVSPCGTYRYRLDRRWSPVETPFVVFVMLNPSTADAEVDDPTIRRCVGLARRWGCHGIRVVNLFAFRTPSVEGLFDAEAAGVDVVGPSNNQYLAATFRQVVDYNRFAENPLVAAWGASAPRDRVEYVVNVIRRHVRFEHLGLTRSGAPRHPLYVSGDVDRTAWGTVIGNRVVG